MKNEHKYYICSKCGVEVLLLKTDRTPICLPCKRGMFDSLKEKHTSKYFPRTWWDDYGRTDQGYIDIPCRCRTPDGLLCIAIPGHCKEISVVICMKCHIRVTDNTLNDVIQEDEYALLE